MKPEEKAAVDSMDALLDRNLDGVEDLPEYLDKVPMGFYKLRVTKCERKPVEVSKEKGSQEKIMAPVTNIEFEVMECLELADTSKNAIEDGAKPKSRFNVSIFWNRDVEKAAAAFKAMFKDVAKAQGWQTLLEIEQKIAGSEIGAQVKSVEDKDKDGKYYHRVSNAQLA